MLVQDDTPQVVLFDPGDAALRRARSMRATVLLPEPELPRNTTRLVSSVPVRAMDQSLAGSVPLERVLQISIWPTGHRRRSRPDTADRLLNVLVDTWSGAGWGVALAGRLELGTHRINLPFEKPN